MNIPNATLDLTPKQKRELLKKLLDSRLPKTSHPDPAGRGTGPVPEPEVPLEFQSFDRGPEVATLKLRDQQFGQIGVSNPWFRSHKGPAGATIQIGRELVNYSSYNYLGLSGDADVSQAAVEAIQRYGTSVSASRMAAGEIPLHAELERALADLVGAEDAVVFTAGYLTSASTIGHLFNSQDLILHDALIHNSGHTGAVLSGARRVAFPHNDVDAAAKVLRQERGRCRRVLLLLEGVYSMDGDICDLPRFLELKKKYKAVLMVDEAHSLGVLGQTGRGLSEHFGIASREVDLWMGTLSKSLASCGGFIAGSRELAACVRYTVPGFVYSAGMSPANTAAALAALRKMLAEPERVQRLRERSQLFRDLVRAKGFNTGLSHDSPVIPLIVGDTVRCLRFSQALFERGINVQGIHFPAVEENAARLRFFLSCTHTEAQIRWTADVLAQEWARIEK
jgi:8-amino-7-oxononanoate synthase